LKINEILNLCFDFDKIDYDNVDFKQIIKLISRFTQVFFKYCHLSLGIGDFFAFNLMSLLILDSLWPIRKKLYAFIECIVSIQIGHCIIRIVQLWWLENCMSTLPIRFFQLASVFTKLEHFFQNQTVKIITWNKSLSKLMLILGLIILNPLAVADHLVIILMKKKYCS